MERGRSTRVGVHIVDRTAREGRFLCRAQHTGFCVENTETALLLDTHTGRNQNARALNAGGIQN